LLIFMGAQHTQLSCPRGGKRETEPPGVAKCASLGQKVQAGCLHGDLGRSNGPAPHERSDRLGHQLVDRLIDRGRNLPAGLVEAVRSISLGRPDLVGRLPNVRCPTLFIAGSDDAMWRPQLAAEQAALVPNARCETVMHAAHCAPLEHPRETASLIRAHWSRVDRKSDASAENTVGQAGV
jgi:pimeloyl-ACP methyl ester carboxylesterase